MNAPDREESVLLDENTEVKVGYKVDSKIVNSADFIFVKEDHTLGNILRMKLLENGSVRFAGYRHPHPLENLIEMKVRTDGSMTSLDAVREATASLTDEVCRLENKFREAKDNFHDAGMGMMG